MVVGLEHPDLPLVLDNASNAVNVVVIEPELRSKYSSALQLTDPPSIDQFELMKPIGEGMSATVWAGKHKISSTLVAVKALKKSSLPTGGKLFSYVKEEKRILQVTSH